MCRPICRPKNRPPSRKDLATIRWNSEERGIPIGDIISPTQPTQHGSRRHTLGAGVHPVVDCGRYHVWVDAAAASLRRTLPSAQWHRGRRHRLSTSGFSAREPFKRSARATVFSCFYLYDSSYSHSGRIPDGCVDHFGAWTGTSYLPLPLQLPVPWRTVWLSCTTLSTTRHCTTNVEREHGTGRSLPTYIRSGAAAR